MMFNIGSIAHMFHFTQSTLETSRAVILAAGLGTRLKSYTEHKPKALMCIADELAIVRVIRSLVAQGIHDIAINLHHHAALIQDSLGNGNHLNANLYYSYETSLLDSGGGVRTALDVLPSGRGVVVHNVDILSNIDITELIHYCPVHGSALALVNNPKHNPHGDFLLQQGRIISKREAKSYTFSGVSVWDEHVLRTYSAQQPFSLLEPIQQNITHQSCAGVVHPGFWFDIGRPHDLVQANRFYHEAYL